MQISTDGLQLHHWDGTRFWASRGCRVLVSRGKGDSFKEWGRVSVRHAGGGEWWRRFSRRRIHEVVALRSGHVLVVVKHHILVYFDGRLLWDHLIPHGSRPLPSGICVLEDGRVLYGEYGSNPQREPVHIRMTENEGRDWHEIWSSEPGTARHVHMLSPVIGRPGEVFVATGDFGEEPGLFRLHVDSGRMRRLGGGSQTWRLLGLIPFRDQWFWGSDCEFEQNHIFALRSGESLPRRVFPIPGPAYGACKDKLGKMYISTAVENPGVHKACIIGSEDGETWRILKCFAKDFMPPRLFGYGVVSFIRGQQDLDELYINLQGLRRRQPRVERHA